MDVHIARRRISDCTALLLKEKPFYGHLLQQFDLHHDPAGRFPMGVSYDEGRGRIRLTFNPELWEQADATGVGLVPWTDANLVAVLEHECLHVVLRHLIRHMKGNRPAWNVAEDMAINQQIRGLPRGAVGLAYGGRTFPAGLHSDGYYELLLEDWPPCPKHGHEGSGGDPCPQCTGQTLDCHEDFLPGGNVEAEEAMRQAVGHAYRRYREQRQSNPGGNGRGTMPSDLVRMIEQMLHRPIDWRHRLRCIGASAVRHGRRTTFRRPNRRYGALYPGRKRARSGKVLVAVDTSGSVSDKLLGAFWHEIRAIAKKADVVVVECDAGLHDVWKLRNHAVPRLKGGGGSDFRPVFDLLAGRGDYPRAWRRAIKGVRKAVFLTDGLIGVPAEKPGLEVFWAVPENRQAPTEAYGERLAMAVEQ